MLNQSFKKNKKLQKEFVPLSKLYSYKLDDFINNLDKKNVIWKLVRNTIGFEA